MIVAVDVTERRRLEQQLRETQKMEAIGRLAAGVAHDFNNILLAIRSYNWLLGQSQDPKAPEHIHNVTQIDHAIDRAATLTRQLLVFGQPELRRVEVIDLAETVLGMRDLLRTLIPEDVDLDIGVDRAPISGEGGSQPDRTGTPQPRGQQSRRDGSTADCCRSTWASSTTR